MDSMWRILQSKTVIKDRWIDLRADHCVTPSGKTIEPYYVLNYPDWVHVVAITASDELVLVRQYRHGAGGHFLELPAGAVDSSDASIQHAARRELEEETGYQAARWDFVSSLHPNPANQTNRLHIFLARGAVRTTSQNLDPGEEGLNVATMPIADVLSGLRNGLLGQALNVASVMLALSSSGHLPSFPR